jgi:hypothetical protein
MQELLKTDYADIMYNEEKFYLLVIWKPKMNDENYKEVFNYCIEYAQSHRVDNYVSDIREQKLITPETRKWFEEDALPRAVETGLQRGAIIFAGNVFKKYYANNILTRTKNFALPLKFFTSFDDAYKWFDSFKE